MDSQNQDMMAAFNQLFTPTVQYPRWFQPHPEIGQILVQSKEEEDELAGRDWTPQPLPGSENPTAKISSMDDVQDALEVLQNKRDLWEQQKATDKAELDAKMAKLDAMMARLDGAPGTPPVAPAPAVSGESTGSAADMPGGLSDASDDVAEEPVDLPAPAVSKTSKK